MGTVLAGDIVRKASTLLHDISGRYWPESDLLDYLNAGQLQLAILRQDVKQVTESIGLIEGARQALPAGRLRLVDIHRNMGMDGATPGKHILIADREAMNAADTRWSTAEPDADGIAHYLYDGRMPEIFWVYPQPPVSAELLEDPKFDLSPLGVIAEQDDNGFWLNSANIPGPLVEIVAQGGPDLSQCLTVAADGANASTAEALNFVTAAYGETFTVEADIFLSSDFVGFPSIRCRFVDANDLLVTPTTLGVTLSTTTLSEWFHVVATFKAVEVDTAKVRCGFRHAAASGVSAGSMSVDNARFYRPWYVEATLSALPTPCELAGVGDAIADTAIDVPDIYENALLFFVVGMAFLHSTEQGEPARAKGFLDLFFNSVVVKQQGDKDFDPNLNAPPPVAPEKRRRGEIF